MTKSNGNKNKIKGNKALKYLGDMQTKNTSRNDLLLEIKDKIYTKLSLTFSKLQEEKEGIEYKACRFELNDLKIICRTSKKTPKKQGQFVTFWKRNSDGITAPFSFIDPFDFYVINVKCDQNFGQFVFPKSELIKRGIVSSPSKDGKRGFRVYTKWDTDLNKTDIKTQKWQLKYFYEINENTNFNTVEELYKGSDF